MEATTHLEKIIEAIKRAHSDLLAWLNTATVERDAIIKEAIKENEAAKIAKLKNKIDQL